MVWIAGIIRRHPHADRDDTPVRPWMPHSQSGDPFTHAFGHLDRLSQRGIGQDQHEFLAPITGTEIPTTFERIAQGMGHRLETVVARLMAEGVVV